MIYWSWRKRKDSKTHFWVRRSSEKLL